MIVDPTGRPAAGKPEAVAIDAYADRPPKLGEALHICDGTNCGVFIVAHVNPDGRVDGVTLQPSGWVPIGGVDRLDAPQLIATIPTAVSWHWGPLCPWKR